jgi:hypothetical protein
MIKLEPGESIIHIVRKHWFVILGFSLLIIFMCFLPLLAIKFFTSSLILGAIPPEIVDKIPTEEIDKWINFAYPLWLSLLWVFFFIEWTDYYLDVWIVTDKRILDIDQKGFFHREVTSFNYAQIEDITVETRGPIQTFFKFGLLEIQTAGHNRNIVIPNAVNPELVRSIVLKQQYNYTLTHSH